MSSEEKDVNLPVASEDKQTVVFCTKCGKEFDLYNELLEDHKFMCSSDFPNFEVKEKSHIKYIEKSDAEDAVKEARKAERQRILKTLRMLQENFQHRVDVALEEKEDAKEDSWVKKRSVVRINCYDLAQRKIQKLCEELESDGLVEEVDQS
jgi:cyclopropane fatty-acyl-phospholipid synthase-like methyltransferase